MDLSLGATTAGVAVRNWGDRSADGTCTAHVGLSFAIASERHFFIGTNVSWLLKSVSRFPFRRGRKGGKRETDKDRHPPRAVVLSQQPSRPSRPFFSVSSSEKSTSE